MRDLRIVGIALLGVAFGITAAPLGATVIPRGEVFRVDTGPDCTERNPDAASLPGGGFVAVWTADTGVQARLFDAAGAAVTPPVAVETGAPPASATVAAVAAGADGRILVVWHDAGRGRIVSRLLSPSGDSLREETLLFPEIGNGELDVAAVPGGGFAVVTTNRSWALMRLLDADGEPSTAVIEVEGYLGFLLVHEPAITAQPDGDLVLAWTLRSNAPNVTTTGLAGRIVPAATAHDPFTWRELVWGEIPLGWHTAPTLGTDAAGNLFAAWRYAPERTVPALALMVHRFDPAGHFFGFPQATAGAMAGLGAPALLVQDGGDFVLAWHGVPAGGASPFSSLYAQAFDRVATPQANPIEIAAAGNAGREEPALVRSAGGEAFAVWQEGRNGAPGTCFSSGILGRRLVPGCQAAPGRLCLGNGRFQLETTWTAPGTGSGSGPGNAVRITRDTGYFWFFDDENVELMVKVLDGRAVNGRFWVFYGSLSNVAWQLRVTDLTTGAAKTYTNPRNQLASRGDTGALPGATTAESFELRPFQAVSVDAAPSHPPGEHPAGPCSLFPITTPPPARPGLCLNQSEFEVEVTWHDPFNGGQGVGGGESLTDDSGYFWFFNPENVELVVKVLDARAVNGKYWVFYGALTNVEYTLRVRHVSGAERIYHNPPFQFRSHADTAAFPLP